MANERPQNDAESLKRSHSAWSNTKLTSLCVVSVLVFTAFWAALGLKDILGAGTLWIIALVVTGALSALCLLGFNKFKR